MKATPTLEKSTFSYFFKASLRFSGKYAPDIVTVQFQNKDIARHFFDSLTEKLPLLNTEYPILNDKNVHITKEQDLFYRRLVMCETGKLDISYLEESLLKTLRADQYDFSYQFILGLIPGDNNSRRLHNLRPSQRKPYVIHPNGHISQREYKPSQYKKEEKAGFTQAQSNTLVDSKCRSRAFGFGKDHRNAKLYGIITHLDDSLINRLLVNDSGTVGRLFDHEDWESASERLDRFKHQLFSKDKFHEFKKTNSQARIMNPFTNEVLARIRFNPYRTVVCICSNTLEARLLAYDFAQELLEHYRVYAEKKGLTVNPDFKIPIIFYIRNNSYGYFNSTLHDIRIYTDEMRKEDEIAAKNFYSNSILKSKMYWNNNFEFLLGLPKISEEILLEHVSGQLLQPLALYMMRSGYTRMLMRLLRTPTLKKQVFNTLINNFRGLFIKNDPIIGSLILAEEFDLANQLILATHSDKFSLQIAGSEFNDITSHLLHLGNPRQIRYMGLETMLIKAAKANNWVVVRLCLKEFRNINKETLMQVFTLALQNKMACEQNFIFDNIFNTDDNLLLFVFNFFLDSSEKWSDRAFYWILRCNFLHAASTILKDPKLSEKNFDMCIESLKHFPDHFSSLAPLLCGRLKPPHIKALCLTLHPLSGQNATKEGIIAMLKQIKDESLSPQDHLFNFYFAFDYSTLSEKLEVETELLRLFKPTIVKHMVLIFIVDRFRCYLKPFHDTVTEAEAETRKWPNLTSVFKNKIGLIDLRARDLIETLDPQQEEILKILDSYFTDIFAIPSEEDIETTYNIVMELFELAPKSQAAPSSADSNPFDFNGTFSNYMRSLNIEIGSHRASTSQTEAVSTTPEEDTEDSLTDSSISFGH